MAATATLHLAFGEGIDYGVLYAIEQMLGCRTESCLAFPSLFAKRLAPWRTIASRVKSCLTGSRIAASFPGSSASYCC